MAGPFKEKLLTFMEDLMCQAFPDDLWSDAVSPTNGQLDPANLLVHRHNNTCKKKGENGDDLDCRLAMPQPEVAASYVQSDVNSLVFLKRMGRMLVPFMQPLMLTKYACNHAIFLACSGSREDGKPYLTGNILSNAHNRPFKVCLHLHANADAAATMFDTNVRLPSGNYPNLGEAAQNLDDRANAAAFAGLLTPCTGTYKLKDGNIIAASNVHLRDGMPLIPLSTAAAAATPTATSLPPAANANDAAP
ncbi:hypothetical protein TSOC_014456, partial [Tetrabaena socialis]